MASLSLRLPRVAPLRARLCNALLCRALPVDFVADTGEGAGATCTLALDGAQAALDTPAPFAPCATLFVRVGGALCRLEFASLDPLALRAELAEWLAPPPAAGVAARDFSTLPPALCQAVLERLFAPALERLLAFLGCAGGFVAAPALDAESAWDTPLPLQLTLPQGQVVYVRASWADAEAAHFVLERLEAMPVRGRAAGAVVSCPVRIGAGGLTPQEAAGVRVGDVLLPHEWTPETPHLLLPQGRAVLCRLCNAVLTVLGTDAAAPKSSPVDEVAMTHSADTPGAMTASTPAADAPLLDAAALARVELPVSFELGSLSLRLEEIAAITPGMTFVMGGEATSVPVRIRVGGAFVGQGRLVDVGGVPGVQVTGLLPQEGMDTGGVAVAAAPQPGGEASAEGTAPQDTAGRAGG